MPASSTFAPFRVRSYRFQWPADLLTSWALEMEFLILGWYVLVETGSVVLLTVFGALQHGGTLIAPVLGMVSDRVGPRTLMTAMRLMHTTIATTLMVLAFAGAVTPVIVLVLVGLTGLIRPSDLGLRAALIADTVPGDYLAGAMGLSRITSDSARIAGALSGAGLIAALGMGPAYVVIACFYALGACLVSRAGSAESALEPDPPAESAAAPAPVSAWSDLREGIAHIWRTPSLMAVMWLVLLFNFTAFPVTNGLLPYVAKDIYLIDRAGLGHLIASVAFGAVIGSVLLHRMSIGVRLPRLMVVSAIIWHSLLLVFAQLGTFAAGVPVLMMAGVVQSLAMVSLTVVLMREAGQRFRGRVMGVRLLAIYSLPVGLLIAGPLIEHIGFAATASAYATLGIACTLVIAARWRAQIWG